MMVRSSLQDVLKLLGAQPFVIVAIDRTPLDTTNRAADNLCTMIFELKYDFPVYYRFSRSAAKA
jgi:hypothetical protein